MSVTDRTAPAPATTQPGATLPADGAASLLDLALVGRVKNSVAAQLSEWRRTEAITVGMAIDDRDEVARAQAFIWSELDVLARERTAAGQPPLAEEAEEAVARRVRADLFGLGGLEELVFDPTVEDVFVNGCDRVFVARAGEDGAQPVGPVAESDDALIELVNRWAARLGRTERRFDVANPRVDLHLPGGFRMHAIMEVTQRPAITIRCPRHRHVGLDELISLGTIDMRLRAVLEAAVKARCNIIVAGGTSSGKTTMLRSLLFAIPSTERLVIIEDTSELGLSKFPDRHPNVVEMETRDANIEGVGAITMRDLTRDCLRMSPDRVIVGEVRGAEALYMLKAMSQGNDGSMCTVHADSARNVAARIRGYCAEGADLPVTVIDAFYRSAVDLVVHLRVLPDRRRVVTSVVEVEKDEGEGVRHNELFSPDDTAPAVFSMRPSDLLTERLVSAGLDPAMIQQGAPSWSG